MNETTPIKQNKFSNGEISADLWGDVEHPKYRHSLRTCKNWLPIPQGPLVKRPGTAFIGFVKDGTYPPRLIPFLFSDTQTFMLEFGDRYIRFYRNGKYVGVDGNLHTYGDGYAGGYYELVTVFTKTMLSYLKYAQVGNVITICYGGQVVGTPAVAPQDLAHTSGANTPWTITPTLFFSPPALAAPTVLQDLLGFFTLGPVYNVGARVVAAGTGAIIWVCIFKTTGIEAPPAAPALNSTGSGIAGNLYWMPFNDLTHLSSRVEWVQTCVLMSAAGITFETPASPVLVLTTPVASDRQIELGYPGYVPPAGYTFLLRRLYRGANGIWGYVQQNTDVGNASSFVDDGRSPDYTRQPPKQTDPFLVNGADSYPSIVGYLDQRRLWAGSVLLPQQLELSKIGDLYNYDNTNVPGSDTDALNALLVSEDLEQCRAFVNLQRGILLTGQSEWVIGGAGGAPIARSNASPRKQSQWGSSWVRPIKNGNGLIFNTAKSNQVRDLFPLYGTYLDIWDGQDLTVMARHLLSNKTIKNWAYQSVPYPVLWAVLNDGSWISMTYQHAPPSFGQQLTEGTVAWAQHSTGGLGGRDTVEDICVVPEPPDDAIYMVTNRIFGGRAIERMQSPIPPTLTHSDFIGALPLVDNQYQVTVTADVKRTIMLDAAVMWDGVNTTKTNLIFTWVAANQFTIAVYGGSVGNWWPVPGGTGLAFSDAIDSGNNCVVLDPDGLNWRFNITGVTSATQATAELQGPFPAYDPANPASAWFTQAPYVVVTNSWGAGIKKVPYQQYAGFVPQDSGTPNGTRGLTALVDGEALGGQVFLNGAFAVLPYPACVAVVGLAYNSDAALLDAYHPNAEVRNKFKNIVRIGFEVSGARDLWFGFDFDNLTQWQQRLVSDAYGVVGLASGYYEDFVTGDWNKSGQCVFRHFSPFPAALTSVLREIRLGDT